MAMGKYQLMIKEKGSICTNQPGKVYSIFIFQNRVTMMNHVLSRPILNRFTTWTDVGEADWENMDQIYSDWASSMHVNDTLFDSVLPYPNTKTYVWNNSSVNRFVQEQRDHIIKRKKKRKRIDLCQIKTYMARELMNTPFVVIEMTEHTYLKVKNKISLLYRFKMIESRLSQNEMDRMDIFEYRKNYDVENCLSMFGETETFISSNESDNESDNE